MCFIIAREASWKNILFHHSRRDCLEELHVSPLTEETIQKSFMFHHNQGDCLEIMFHLAEEATRKTDECVQYLSCVFD